jgi:glycosyltransferase involved in cell wall biosynthesis
MKPLVSILVPAYNAQDYLADTLRSAVAQTWPRKEIIIVDDGSTDQTLAVARQFASADVRIVTKKNQGAAAARNTAFSLSQGDYIQWLDADDLIAPDKIARQVEALDRCPSRRILLSSAWGRFIYRANRARFVPTSLWCNLSPAEWMIRQMEDNVYMQTATWLVSRELTEAAGPWDTRLLGDDDGEYFCRVLLASEGTHFVPESKVYYRLAPGSLSYIGFSDRRCEAQWISMKLHIQYVRSLEDSPRARAACVTYVQNWMTSFYPERMDIFRQAEEMARSLGGQLRIPPLSWKYSWIDAAFGRHVARRAQVYLPGLRWSLVRFWDRALFHFENRSRARASDRHYPSEV